MNFEFATANRIIFSKGAVQKAGKLAKEYGDHLLVVLGMDKAYAAPLFQSLDEHFTSYQFFPVYHEPTLRSVQSGVEFAREQEINVIISMGGGSSIDTGKAISALLTNKQDIYTYLEVIGKAQPLEKQPVPFIAIPTTAGTGSEVTRNSVLESTEHGVKVSLRSPLMLPRIALIDPELSVNLPPQVSAYTGMDALTQVLEPFVSNEPNPLIDPLCQEGLSRAARSIQDVYEDGSNVFAREDMSLTSLIGGLALANSKLGAVHGFAGPFGGMFHAPHGAICARLLPAVMEQNIKALREREPGNQSLERYIKVAQILTDNPESVAEDGWEWVRNKVKFFKIPYLSSYGFGKNDYLELINKAENASSMKGNPIPLNKEELWAILEQST